MAKREEKVTESQRSRFRIYVSGLSASRRWATWCGSKNR